MGCGSSKNTSVGEPAKADAKTQNTPATSQAATDDANGLAQEKEATETLNQAKEISKEAFANGIKKLLDLCIDGYPRALRSTLARRNELLRQVAGSQDEAADKIKAQAANVSEEAKSWLLGLVPYVGLPAAIIYPMWKQLRRVCLLAAVFGLSLKSEDSKARILHAFAGVRAVPAAEFAVESAVQLVWKAFVGPIAGLVPVGTLVSKIANVEGAVVDAIGRDTFSEVRQPVTQAEYGQELDPEPTHADYIALAKEGTAFALYSAWEAGCTGVDVAMDKKRREQALAQAIEVSKGAVTIGQGAAVLAMDAGKAGVSKGIEVVGRVTGGSKTEPKT